MLEIESYTGAGIVYVAGRDVGFASSVNISIETDTQELQSNRPGGGLADSVSRIKNVKLKMTLNTFSNANMALALRGKVEVLAAEAQQPETLTAILDGLAETSYMLDPTKAVTVTNDAGDETYVEGVDYVASAAGIRALSDGGITEGQPIKVTGTSLAGNALEALVESGVTVPVTVDGVNDSTGKPFVITFYLWKPSPTAGLDVLSTNFGSFDIEGAVLANPNIVASGKSKFFRRRAASVRV
ncbi:hypothetical protein MJ923_07890 [Shewanella sp. 3B26]|uniref:Uncharacterized protein n=1 Tax=Shewanella zhuhaiensis TaxID=2919576 RepID=A0AAJ1BGI9_9GAMM|nr:hypothetical protein [Shewanella zhuhaiensis]MCH4294225.1 hypothetical protein [Shewanella zhuhaiensis]